MEYLPLVLIIPLGLVLGSFFNVCIYRIPKKESIVFPPSHCTSCGERLRIKDLIPVISYFMLKGKCRYCNDKISIQYPVVELLTCVLFVLLYFTYGLKLNIGYMVLMMFFTSILIIITFIDIKHKIIPDVIIFPGVIIGFMFNTLGHIFITESLFIPWYESLLGFFVGGLPLYLIGLIGTLIYKRDAMGGGDVKLMAMVGSFIGWKMVLLALFFGIIIGAIIGVIIKYNSGSEGLTEIPFGPMLSLGSLLAALYGQNILQWYLSLLYF